jgi:ATP/maltotriose-dependent transcriptional regulator MalT
MQALTRARGLLPQTLDPLRRTSYLNIFSYIAALRGEYTEALELAEQLTGEAADSGLEFVAAHALLTKARALVGLRRLREAAATLRELDSLPEAKLAHVQTNSAVVASLARIAAGDLDGAAVILERRPHPEAVPALQAEFLAHRALVAAARRRVLEVERAMAAADLGAFREARVLMCLTESILQSESNEAGVSIREALVTGHADAVVTACRAAPSLAKAGVRAGLHDELTSLFIASRDFDIARHGGISIPREHRRGGRLSTREMDVLELLVHGLSNGEIAQTLFISQSTAKVHVRHIFEKLGVHTRAEAAARWPIQD